jgi:hypothetical protein
MPLHASIAPRLGAGALATSLAALLVAGAARAEAPRPPPAADPRLYAPPSVREEATGFACSVETLVSGADCVLESDAPASTDTVAQARDNEALAASLSGWACAFAARAPGDPAADRGVLAQCEKAFKEQALGCGAEGARALLDGRGLFAPEARRCYAALGEVLASTRTMAATTAPCCRCLAAARCLDGDRCHRDLLGGAVPSRASACLQASCATACRSFLPDAAPAPAKPAATEPLRPFCLEPHHPEHRCDRI